MTSCCCCGATRSCCRRSGALAEGDAPHARSGTPRQRALAATQAMFESAAPAVALDLLATAESGPLDALQRARPARPDRVRAQARTRRTAAPARRRPGTRGSRSGARPADVPRSDDAPAAAGPVIGSMNVFELWDGDAFHAVANRAVRLARETGALTMLGVALVYLSGVHPFAGQFDVVEVMIQEAETITTATGNASLVYGALVLAGWQGIGSEAQERIDVAGVSATAHCRRSPAQGVRKLTPRARRRALLRATPQAPPSPRSAPRRGTVGSREHARRDRPRSDPHARGAGGSGRGSGERSPR